MSDGIMGMLQDEIGACRELPPDEMNRCGKPSEYVLWGKMIKREALGPRCAECAAKHVGWHALSDSSWAIIDIRRLALRAACAPELVLNGEQGA